MQYTLEQHRNGTAPISIVNLGAALNSSDCGVGEASEIGGPDNGSAAEVSAAWVDGADQSRLLPAVVLPQVGETRRKIVATFPFWPSVIALWLSYETANRVTIVYY